MSDDDQSMTPTDGEVLQEEAPDNVLEAVPVAVQGPVRTQALPARAAGFRRTTIGTEQPFRIASADPRRRALQIQAYDAAGTCTSVLIANTRSQVEHTGARLVMLAGAGTAVATPLLTLTATDEVWVLPVDGPCEINTFGEQWAE